MRKLAIVVALSSTVLATPALARDGAWYVGGDFGAVIVEDLHFDFGLNPTIPSGNGSSQVALNHDYGYDAAVFVGYDLGAFRIEAEVAYKRSRVEDIETAIRLPGFETLTPLAPAGGGITPDLFPAGGGRTSALSFMINGMLDFGDDDGISGFVGGGVGMARVDFNNVRAFDNGANFVDDSDTRFAWQVVAGLRQAISDNIDVTVRYRFFNADNVRTSDFRGFDAETRYRSHSLLGGITFNFGGREPIENQTCWDGSIIPVTDTCPPRPVIETPPPTQMQTCWDGSSIPATQTCPPRPIGPFIVFFDWDKDEITPQAAAILDNAAQAYQTAGSASIVLAGHADRSGSDEYNVGLSQRRANNVRGYMAGRGVPDGSMTTEAFGESRPLVDTADGVREPQNRRVEITFGPGSGW